MEALRVTGLMSGLDTNSIVDSYMATAKAPIVKLNQQIDSLTFEKSTYNKLITMVTDVKNAMLPLKLESTFKSKVTSSSNEDIASATASINTPPGSYTVKVDQIAEPAYATSTYIQKLYSTAGAGIDDIKNLYTTRGIYDQQSGMHTYNVSTSGNSWIVKDSFQGNNNESYSLAKSANASIFDSNGNSTQEIKDTLAIVYTYNGESYTINIDMDYPKDTAINKIASDLNLKINAYFDAKHGHDGAQSMQVTTLYDETTKKFSFGFYDVDTKNDIEVLGFLDPNDLTSSSSNTYKLSESLGLNIISPSVETKEINNYMVSNSADNLVKKMTDKNKGGFFAGATIETTGLTEGTFKIYQDSSVVSRPATKTTFYGGKFNKIENATTKPTKKDIDEWLSTKMGKTGTSNFFPDTPPLSDLNGYFYINGVKIEIGDYKQLSPNDIMAKVNSSGAGVTMSYDYEKNIFKLENNKTGAIELTVGNDTDTSKFFNIFQVGLVTKDALYVRGQDAGKLDTTTPIDKLSPSFSRSFDSGTFTINGVSIYIDTAKDSVDDIISKVNKSGAGVTMSYDSATDKFSLKSEDGNKIKVGSDKDTSTFLVSAGLAYVEKAEQEIGSAGKDAVFSVNGVKYQRQSNEVNDVIPGMTFSLKGEGSTIINVKTDTDRAVTALAEFASKYNTLINALNPTEIAYNDDLRSKYSEPLTDEKKESMSEDEIKKYQENYEKVAYYDIITRSSEIRSLKFSLRSNLTKSVISENSPYKTITEVGITIAGSETRNTTVTKLGLLFDVTTEVEDLETYIKENSKFVSLLEEDPDGVFSFFADTETVYETNPLTGQQTSKVVSVGWGRVYSDFLDSTVNSSSAIYKKASSNGSIESEISSLKDQIDVQTRRVEMYLERLYAQFAAMEERVGALQQSASYLTNLSSQSAK